MDKRNFVVSEIYKLQIAFPTVNTNQSTIDKFSFHKFLI